MTENQSPNAAQQEFWSGDRGRAWVARADQFDAQLELYNLRVVAALAPRPGETILDIGCGAGATSMAVGQAVGSSGKVIGLDISPTMLGLARERAELLNVRNVEFVEVDVQTTELIEHHAAGVVSRFGVMFFEDPVAAFSNIADMVVPDGRLAFACWGPVEANEWMLGPAQAVAELLPPPPPAEPGTPGPYGFDDNDRVTSILESAGWENVNIEDVNDWLYLGGPGTVADAVEFVLGGTAMAAPLAALGVEVVADAASRLEAALTPHHDGTGVRYPALVRIVTARKA